MPGHWSTASPVLALYLPPNPEGQMLNPCLQMDKQRSRKEKFLTPCSTSGQTQGSGCHLGPLPSEAERWKEHCTVHGGDAPGHLELTAPEKHSQHKRSKWGHWAHVSLCSSSSQVERTTEEMTPFIYFSNEKTTGSRNKFIKQHERL